MPEKESGPRSVLLIGAGKMGGALLAGWLPRGPDDGNGAGDISFTVIDPMPGADLTELARGGRIALNPNPDDVAASRPTVTVLAVKPQIMDEALRPWAGTPLARGFFVSIAAGCTVAGIRRALAEAATPVVRAMPNTPAAYGRGITVCTRSDNVTDSQAALAETLLSAVGEVVWVRTEAEIDAATAVSGSGPAYVFYLAECLADAARAVGLEPEVADRLARHTVAGAGEMLHRDVHTPTELRVQVTSPGGTTQAALKVLMGKDGLKELMERAVKAAKKRAEELGEG